jgi:hypothetical protein
MVPDRHEQREHEAGHEQHADQRHAADQLDVDHAERCGSPASCCAAPAPPPPPAGRPSHHRQRGQHDGQRQAAPAVGLDPAQARHAALHQREESRQHGHPQPAAARASRSARMQLATSRASMAGGQQRPPLLLVRVAAEDDERYFSATTPQQAPTPRAAGRRRCRAATALEHGPLTAAAAATQPQPAPR